VMAGEDHREKILGSAKIQVASLERPSHAQLVFALTGT
jgi:hypothetical protein